MACSSIPSVISLKATIKKLQNRVIELESNGGDSHIKAIVEQSRKTKDQVIVLHKKRTMTIGKEFLSTLEAPIPTYNQLYHPPKKEEQYYNIIYGKDALLKYYPHTHHVLHCQNLRTVRSWIKIHGFYKHCDLRHNKKGKDELEDLIEENYNQIKELDFNSTTYKWEKKDIYAYCLRHMQAKRKNTKNKSPYCLENITLEENKETKEKDISLLWCLMHEENIKNDDDNVQEKEILYIDILTSEGLDDFYCPEISFDHKSCFEQVLEGCEDEALYNDDEEWIKQGPFMTLLEDVKQVVQTIEEEAPKSMTLDYHEDISARKSKRAPKWSEKVKENMKRKKPSFDFSKKKMLKTSKLTKSLNEDASMLCLNKHDKDVHVFDKEDEETILMKYLELSTIDTLWTSLRSNFNIIKRNTDFIGDQNEQSADGMQRAFVQYLLVIKKVVVKKHADSSLSVDDISIVDLH